MPCDRPLRVLHIASGDLWAGAEAQICTLLRTLTVQVPDMRIAAAVMNDGELAAQLRGCGVDVHIFDENRLGSLGILVALRRLMGAWRPDIVHTHRTKENILGAVANRLTHRVPSVRTVHGASERPRSGIRGLREELISSVDRWCARNLQGRVIAVSADMGRQLARTLPAEKIAIIENGVDIAEIRSHIHPVDFRTCAPEAAHVGLAGRLAPVKRVDLFIRIASLLQQGYPQTPWRFHVFGDGPLRETLERQARLEKHLPLTFHGHRSDFIACLAALDVLVMCSDHEGMPMTALESLAVGTRIAAHAVGGLNEALAGTKSAILVEEHEPIAYAEAVRDLLSRDVDRGGERAVPERLRATRTAELTYALYRQLLCVGSPGGKA